MASDHSLLELTREHRQARHDTQFAIQNFRNLITLLPSYRPLEDTVTVLRETVRWQRHLVSYVVFELAMYDIAVHGVTQSNEGLISNYPVQPGLTFEQMKNSRPLIERDLAPLFGQGWLEAFPPSSTTTSSGAPLALAVQNLLPPQGTGQL